MRFTLCTLGHLATTRALRDHGLTERELTALARSEAVVRVKKGLYACRHLGDPMLNALARGGRLDCVSVLSAHGIWVGDIRGTHLRIHASGASAFRRRKLAGFTLHWAKGDPRGPIGAVTVFEALVQAMNCLSPDDVVAAIESAYHLGRITRDEVDRLVASAPRRLAGVLRELELGAQSGYETRARLRLRRAGYRVDIQVAIPGVGHIDLLVEGRLAIEIDGATHLNTFETDRDRDLHALAAGIPTLRLRPRHIDLQWPLVLAAVEAFLRSGEEDACGSGAPARNAMRCSA